MMGRNSPVLALSFYLLLLPLRFDGWRRRCLGGLVLLSGSPLLFDLVLSCSVHSR